MDEDEVKLCSTGVSLTLPIAALSVNKMYGGVKKRSVYYKNFRRKCFEILSSLHDGKKPELKGDLILLMEVGFSSKLSDLSNSIKAIEDILVAFYDFNDRQICRIEMDKVIVKKGEEYIKINLYQKEVNKRRVNAKKV